MSPKAEDDDRKVSQNTFGLELWIEIRGKRAPVIQENGKDVVALEANEPYELTPYSIFAKNNSPQDLYVSLNVKGSQGDFFHLLKKNDTHEFKSFRGENLGFKLIPVTMRIKNDTKNLENPPPKEYGLFIIDVRSVVKYDPPIWVPPSYHHAGGAAVFSGTSTDMSGGSSAAGSNLKKKVELVSAGRDTSSVGRTSGAIPGYFKSRGVGPKIGDVNLYYASIADLAEALHQQSLKRHAAKVEAGLVKQERGGSSTDVDESERKAKKPKVIVELDLTSDTEETEA